jgi:hypothetical protein
VSRWLGLVGPGVRARGVDDSTWSDHTDVRPTILTLVGLEDLYTHDGRLLVEALQNWATPDAADKATFSRLAKVYKQINAPFGDLSMNALTVSTAALESADANDATYHRLSDQITAWTSQRDGLVSQMKSLLRAAAFDNATIDAKTASLLIDGANDLLKQVSRAVKLLK